MISFFEFRRLVNASELDGVIIAENARSNFVKELVPILKFYEIPRVGVMDLNLPNPFWPIHWLNTDKAYLPYLNSNLVDGCNLNCKGCSHFAPLFNQNEIYPLEAFRRDIRRLSQICDIISFRLLGGEPLLLKNIDEYIKITRQYFQKSNLGIVTNVLLLPAISKKIFDALRENNFIVYVTAYPPTIKILDNIKAVLNKNNILYNISDSIKNFGVCLTFHNGNDTQKSRRHCVGNDNCRFLRDGKLYKCPIDALKFRFEEKFGIEGLPTATSVDIYSSNFSLLLKMLDGDVEMCSWCSEQVPWLPWEKTNNPKLEDWLADPDEIKNFQ